MMAEPASTQNGRYRVMTRVLGLDIGASTTRAQLVVDDSVVAEARAASASMSAAGVITAPGTREFITARLAPLTTSGRVVVVDDASLVLPAAGLTDGIAVICGTGSMGTGCWHGRSAWAGGWGYLLGDEGSGYWIVRSAVRELLARADRSADAGPLGPCLLACAGAPDLTALRGEFYRQPQPSHWARHAPAVLDCPDPAAARIAEAAAQALAGLAAQVAERLGAAGG